MIECLLNKKMEPISGKWYTEEDSDIPDHQPVQEKIDNNPEDGNSECRSTPGVLDTVKVRDAEQKYLGHSRQNISKKTQKTACDQEQRFFMGKH
jgi:hypothetical protein